MDERDATPSGAKKGTPKTKKPGRRRRAPPQEGERGSLSSAKEKEKRPGQGRYSQKRDHRNRPTRKKKNTIREKTLPGRYITSKRASREGKGLVLGTILISISTSSPALETLKFLNKGNYEERAGE